MDYVTTEENNLKARIEYLEKAFENIINLATKDILVMSKDVEVEHERLLHAYKGADDKGIFLATLANKNATLNALSRRINELKKTCEELRQFVTPKEA